MAGGNGGSTGSNAYSGGGGGGAGGSVAAGGAGGPGGTGNYGSGGGGANGGSAGTQGTGSVPSLWIPVLLASFTVTLGTAPGIAGSDVNGSQLFATSIALVTGNANVSNEVLSPTGNVIHARRR